MSHIPKPKKLKLPKAPSRKRGILSGIMRKITNRKINSKISSVKKLPKIKLSKSSKPKNPFKTLASKYKF